MSRTYRRKKKGALEQHPWILKDWKRVDCYKWFEEVLYEPSEERYGLWPIRTGNYQLKEHWIIVPVELKGKERKKALAKFHGDTLQTMNQVPSWYKRDFCRRPFRAKEKHMLRQVKKYPNEEHVFPVLKKDALYYW